MGKESRNKGTDVFIRWVISLAVFLCGEYGYTRFVLNMLITGKSSTFLTALIWGGCVIAIFYIILAYILDYKIGTKSGKIVFILISTALLSSICFIILDSMYGRQLLEEIDYEHETDYFLILVFSVLVDAWTIAGCIVYKAVRLIKSRSCIK